MYTERSFGVSVGGVLCALAVYQFWTGSLAGAAAIGGVGVLLVLFGQFVPQLLTRPAAWWWKFSHVLGYVNTRILLSVAFFFVLVPLGTAWRIIGRDPMGRRRERWSGWSEYPRRYANPQHYRRMF